MIILAKRVDKELNWIKLRRDAAGWNLEILVIALANNHLKKARFFLLIIYIMMVSMPLEAKLSSL